MKTYIVTAIQTKEFETYYEVAASDPKSALENVKKVEHPFAEIELKNKDTRDFKILYTKLDEK